MMTGKLWVLTGYSHKMDGLLVVIDAPTEAEALLVGAYSVGGRLISVEYEGDMLNAITCDARVDEPAILDDLKEDEPRYWWMVEVQEVEFNTNLAKAVQW